VICIATSQHYRLVLPITRKTGWRKATEGLSPDRAAKALMAAGYLIPDGNRPQRKVSLPDNTRPRMYCVKGSILDD